MGVSGHTHPIRWDASTRHRAREPELFAHKPAHIHTQNEMHNACGHESNRTDATDHYDRAVFHNEARHCLGSPRRNRQVDGASVHKSSKLPDKLAVQVLHSLAPKPQHDAQVTGAVEGSRRTPAAPHKARQAQQSQARQMSPPVR